jgi:hypothetical protein
VTADLTEAERLWNDWRALGYSPTEAMERVKASGVLEEAAMAEQFERLGMSKAAAATAARGRDPRQSPEPHTRMVENFEGLGMTRAEAEIAAKGRGGDAPSRTPGDVAEGGHPLLNMARKIVVLQESIREAEELQRQRFAREEPAAAAAWKRKRR